MDIKNQVMAIKNSLTQSEEESRGVSHKTQFKPTGGEISLYTDVVTDRTMAITLKKLKVAFPQMDPNFFDILSERIIANGFTDKRLTDAVNNVIDNFQYKQLNVSDIVKFDKKMKLYTHTEVSAMVTAGKASFEDFGRHEVNGVMYRYFKTDLL